jgi:hypothetical protein
MEPTTLLTRRKSCYGFLSPLKIHRPRPGLNPRTLGPVASTLPLDHRGPILLYLYKIFKNYYFRAPRTIHSMFNPSHTINHAAVQISHVQLMQLIDYHDRNIFRATAMLLFSITPNTAIFKTFYETLNHHLGDFEA